MYHINSVSTISVKHTMLLLIAIFLLVGTIPRAFACESWQTGPPTLTLLTNQSSRSNLQVEVVWKGSGGSACTTQTPSITQFGTTIAGVSQTCSVDKPCAQVFSIPVYSPGFDHFFSAQVKAVGSGKPTLSPSSASWPVYFLNWQGAADDTGNILYTLPVVDGLQVYWTPARLGPRGKDAITTDMQYTLHFGNKTYTPVIDQNYALVPTQDYLPGKMYEASVSVKNVKYEAIPPIPMAQAFISTSANNWLNFNMNVNQIDYTPGNPGKATVNVSWAMSSTRPAIGVTSQAQLSQVAGKKVWKKSPLIDASDCKTTHPSSGGTLVECSHQFSGLIEGPEYLATVTIKDGNNPPLTYGSNKFTVVKKEMPPSAPSGIAVAHILLKWTVSWKPVSGATGYYISTQSKDVIINPVVVPANKFNTQITGAGPSTVISIQTKAEDSQGKPVYSEPVTFSLGKPPGTQ